MNDQNNTLTTSLRKILFTATRLLMKLLFRYEIKGLEHYHQAGERVVIIANHASYWDGVFLAAILPGTLTFAVDTTIANQTWRKIILKAADIFPIDPLNPLKVRALIKYLQLKPRLVIFPEGRVTTTGGLMKIYEGAGIIADKLNANILPIYIDGSQYTAGSVLKGKFKIRWFPKIIFTIFPPRKLVMNAELAGKPRREILKKEVESIMQYIAFAARFAQQSTLIASMLQAKKNNGGKHIIVEDAQKNNLTYDKLIIASIIMGRRIVKCTQPGEYVGVLLPNAVAAVVIFYAMQVTHRVPAILNFSAGQKNILSACKMTSLKIIYTSQKFVEGAKLQPTITALKQIGITIIYLEDLKSTIHFFEKIYAKCISYFPGLFYKADKSFTNTPAVVLFTSGSEGEPKGVVLSHANLLANQCQISAIVDFGPTDTVLSVLPLFHAFGLNMGLLLPIAAGVRVFLYPSPLHYRIIPEIAYEIGATLIYGTDVFLANYAKHSHPYNFYRIRYVFAGADKIRDETKLLWMEKFGIRIFEGYGVTEASPVLSTTTPQHYEPNSIGRFLPGINYELQPINEIKSQGRLIVSGPNIMLGYIFSHRPNVVVPLKNGVHDTGDIVSIDENGFLRIIGRAKRFIKIAGEMISLAAVEEQIALLWPNHIHALIIDEDNETNEKLILITTSKEADKKTLLSHFKKIGMPNISCPRKIIIAASLPLLGSGKVDYPALQKLYLPIHEKHLND